MNEQQAVVIDTNVILRHLLNDHDEHSSRASALFLMVRLGEHSVRISGVSANPSLMYAASWMLALMRLHIHVLQIGGRHSATPCARWKKRPCWRLARILA